MYPTALHTLIKDAVQKLETTLAQTSPFMATSVSQWMRHLAGHLSAENYFLHPSAYPILFLPWCCEATLIATPNLKLQSSLLYSTINGYYYIRLMDNLMDDPEATVERQLLPALNFFHTEFLTAYHAHFPTDHPFWADFKQIWLDSGEATMRDATLTDIDLPLFKQVVAQKLCAVKIPLTAVCYQHERLDLLPQWFELVEVLSCWHQMMNDLFDWHTDSVEHINTYFLSEAQRRKQPTESVASWVSREGFAWGGQVLHGWMAEMQTLAQALNHDPLSDYLAERERLFTQREQDALAGLKTMSQLFQVLN